MKPSVESIVLNHFPSKENDSMASLTKKKKGKKIEEEEKFVERDRSSLYPSDTHR